MMEALEFFKARKRMCEATKCASCKLFHVQGGCCIAPENEKINAVKEVIDIVEQWAKEHPVKTRQSVFLEQYPTADADENGVLEVCPALLFASHRGKKGGCSTLNRSCDDCRKEFWLAEAEDV
jgi:hypothetical protein